MRRIHVVWLVSGVVVLLGFTAWLHDFVTPSGAGRTVYTAECAAGSWRGKTCTGHLIAGDRYRFRALKNHREVLYWTAGSTQPSGKMTDCTVLNARDWTCRQAPSQPPPMTMAMANGHAVAAPGQAPTRHCVDKWKWLLLAGGVTWFQDANT
jgi:hypothetical protein